MKMDLNWFLFGPLPSNTVSGSYDVKLVILSYVIAVLASYVALDFVGRLRAEKSPQYKIYWIAGGAFAMGAGIWSMHFIGMLAFVMAMPMSYELLWTISSMLVAIAASAFALYILKDQKRPFADVAKGGILIGLAIATMHYMGMEGMKTHVNIQYLPGLFTVSILIAIFASEAALWLTIESTKRTGRSQVLFKAGSALVMGIAICGMHYTGMAAAVFTPLAGMSMTHSSTTIHPTWMALFIAGVTSLIIGLALTVSTYYRKMLNAIQNEKEFLKAMLNNLDDGIIACDAQGKITVFNQALLKFVGNIKPNPQALEQADYFELYELNRDTPLAAADTPLCQALEGKRIHGKELLLKFKNGITRNVVIDGQPIIREDGYALGAVIAIHDITELKQTEKIKSEFVSVVSHELRTPLTSILGSLGLIMGGTVGEFSDKARKLLDIANKNCERLLLLINDILDMEKIESGKMVFDMQSVEVNRLVNEAIAANKAYGEKYGIDIELKDSLPDTYVQADPHRLMQVLANLISNAVKFSNQGGKVTISLSTHDQQVRVSVTDQGSGIPLEFQPRIFQKFSQADSSSTRGKSGTGLGLSISKIIIDKLGGHINFTSQPGQGTTFYFDLPSSDYAPVEETDSLATDEKRFLICEDDLDQAKYLSLLMEASGWQCDIAGSVGEAKILLEKHTYEAILLDLILPDQDGITFIRELRNSPKTHDLPIIVLSIIAETGQAIINGDALSVIDWLEKPINFGKLTQAISRIQHPQSSSLPVVLHIEDDPDTQKIIHEVLGKTVSLIAVDTLKKAKAQLLKNKVDAVILDLLLPDGNGSSLLPLLAQRQIPVIVYSATELDKDFSRYVIDALVKSKITNNELLTKIKNLFPAPLKEDHYVQQNS